MNVAEVSSHEAAHAAAAISTGIGVRRVGLDAKGGFVEYEPHSHTRSGAMARVPIVLAGLIETGDDIPSWPLDPEAGPDSERGDRRMLATLANQLDLTEREYNSLVSNALKLSLSSEFLKLRRAIASELEQHSELDADALRKVKAATEGTMMLTKRIQLTDTIPLDEGEMIAYASTFNNVDAQNDRVMPGAFASTVAKIKAGNTLPLIWGHDAHGSPQNFVGQIIDAGENAEGLEVHARFDLEDPVGRKAWRPVKDGAINKLSIGYRIPAGGQRRAKDGANELTSVELFEVSLVLTPANDQARVLAVKSASRKRSAWDYHPDEIIWDDTDALLARCKAIEREFAPVQIATFEC